MYGGGWGAVTDGARTGDRLHLQLSPRGWVRDDEVADGDVSQRRRHLRQRVVVAVTVRRATYLFLALALVLILVLVVCRRLLRVFQILRQWTRTRCQLDLAQRSRLTPLVPWSLGCSQHSPHRRNPRPAPASALRRAARLP